jgi:flavin reductase (DIM6/NTAB) family NADH-FMN oxidoreductase RutF
MQVFNSISIGTMPNSLSLFCEDSMFQSLGARPFAVPAPVFLVGSYTTDNCPNIMTAAWGGIVASQPPCMAVSLQRVRASYTAILERQAFTLNIPSAGMVAEVDFAGLVSGKKTNKFKALNLTPLAAEHVDAPLVAECPVAIELKLMHTLELGSHVQLVGEVMDVKIHKDCLDEQNLPLMGRINPLLFVPLCREYWTAGEMAAKAFSVGRSIVRPLLDEQP